MFETALQELSQLRHDMVRTRAQDGIKINVYANWCRRLEAIEKKLLAVKEQEVETTS